MSTAPGAAEPSPRVIRCPRCGGPSVYASWQPHRPFCSERCRAMDFGAWAQEQYRVEPPAGGSQSTEDEPWQG